MGIHCRYIDRYLDGNLSVWTFSAGGTVVSEKESEGGINDTDIRMDHICRVALRSVGDPQK